MNSAFLKPHRFWLLPLAAGLLLLFVASPLARLATEAAQHHGQDIAAERARLQDSLNRFEEDMRLAQKLDGTMSAETIDRLLAPVDRLRVAAELERQAASANFSRFTYRLSPARTAKTDGGNAVDGLTESDLMLSADMPLDTDATTFMGRLGELLPGRVHLRHLALTRAAGDAPLSLANMHMEAELQWLSNAATTDTTGAP
jgi:hypothetical protein